MDRGAGGGSYTPSLHSQQHHAGAVPNYMVATELAKARVRSQSAPRQQPSTPEHDRLSGGSSFGAGGGIGPWRRGTATDPGIESKPQWRCARSKTTGSHEELVGAGATLD